MKKIFFIAALALCFVACQNETPFDTQDENDAPLILKPYNESGTGSFTYILADESTPLIDSVTVTPSKYTTVHWIVDDEIVCTGTKINRCFASGMHSLVIEAVTTVGKRTERKGSISVGGGSIPTDAVVMFEGSKTLKWDTENIKFTKVQMSAVQPGMKIFIEFEVLPSGDPGYYNTEKGIQEEYQALRILSAANWDYTEKDILPQTDMSAVASPFSFDFGQGQKDLLDSEGSMSLVGWGLNIKKIAYK